MNRSSSSLAQDVSLTDGAPVYFGGRKDRILGNLA